MIHDSTGKQTPFRLPLKLLKDKLTNADEGTKWKAFELYLAFSLFVHSRCGRLLTLPSASPGSEEGDVVRLKLNCSRMLISQKKDANQKEN